MEKRQHPVFGKNPFKLGVFNANCDGGLTVSKAPERWKADWDENLELALICEQAGIEFILPAAKWRGFGGDANVLGRSFETLTYGAAIGAATKKIGVFVTVHVPLVTPVFAAKAVATIDHVTHGRVGLNIVCGWNQEEFDLHGVKIDPNRRYAQGLEWFTIFSRLLAGEKGFDWDGEFYKLRGLVTDPLSVQRPWPPIMNAGFSVAGREFAARSADILFTTISEVDQVAAVVQSIQDASAAKGRMIDVYTMTHVVCRPTRREAEEYFHYFAEEMADTAAAAYHLKQRKATAGSDTKFEERPSGNRLSRQTGLAYAGSLRGVFPLVGTPDEIVAEMTGLHRANLAGVSISFLNYLREIPYFIQEVLPRMERAGLRLPADRLSQSA
ncbi:MAG: LLM class flavin-dependent oxidoreductase [Reyranellaceae bacterium]